MWILFWDPFSFMTLMIVYMISFIVVIIISMLIAPKVAEKLSGRFSLNASMAIAMISIILGGLAGVGIITYVLMDVIGATPIPYLIFGIIIFYIIFNGIVYLLSPAMINLMYGAKRDPELQKIVDQVASRSGFSKAPKAVVVRGPPNAFAYGNFLTGRYVAVSTSMLRLVDRNELEAVIGHELGHHKHRDGSIMLFIGMIPSILYFTGLLLIRLGLISGFTSRRDGERRNGGLIFILIGILAVVMSILLNILVLAFSRLREYYADLHGARVSGARYMQRSLAKLYLYYNRFEDAREMVSNSRIKALFIYALTQAVANPLYDPYGIRRSEDSYIDWRDIDSYIERIKKIEEPISKEIMSTHPPIPKRLRFLDKIEARVHGPLI
ncbi:MAG: zinc metalloprotease HtpX [Desulfurococcaceae archaeon]